MARTGMKVLMILAGIVVALGFVAPQAHATAFVDFACNSAGLACTGSVTSPSSGQFVGSGIGVVTGNLAPSQSNSDVFTLNFNTSAGTISLNDADDAGELLSGTITSFSHSGNSILTTITLNGTWATLPADVQAALGTTSALSSGAVIAINISLNSKNDVTSVDMTLIPVPEPATMALLGSGLLAMGGLLKRKLKKS